MQTKTAWCRGCFVSVGAQNRVHAAWNEAVSSRSRDPALERTALEAPASCDNLARQEPRNKDIVQRSLVPKLFIVHFESDDFGDGIAHWFG